MEAGTIQGEDSKAAEQKEEEMGEEVCLLADGAVQVEMYEEMKEDVAMPEEIKPEGECTEVKEGLGSGGQEEREASEEAKEVTFRCMAIEEDAAGCAVADANEGTVCLPM